jgi:hypothetical protein
MQCTKISNPAPASNGGKNPIAISPTKTANRVAWGAFCMLNEGVFFNW